MYINNSYSHMYIYTMVTKLTSLHSYRVFAEQVMQPNTVPSLMLLSYTLTNVFKVGVLCILFSFFVFTFELHGP